MWQLCLSSQPPILISSVLLLYCLQAPFCLGICLPAPSFAQSARQARQLDLLHVLQGFVLGVLQEISLALGMHRHAGESQGLHTSLRTKSRNTVLCPYRSQVPSQTISAPWKWDWSPSCSLEPAQGGRQQPALDRWDGHQTLPTPCHQPWEVISAWTEGGCRRRHFLFHSQQ